MTGRRLENTRTHPLDTFLQAPLHLVHPEHFFLLLSAIRKKGATGEKVMVCWIGVRIGSRQFDMKHKMLFWIKPLSIRCSNSSLSLFSSAEAVTSCVSSSCTLNFENYENDKNETSLLAFAYLLIFTFFLMMSSSLLSFLLSSGLPFPSPLSPSASSIRVYSTSRFLSLLFFSFASIAPCRLRLLLVFSFMSA